MCRSRQFHLVLPACAALLGCTPVHAAGKDCTGYDSLKDNPTLEAAKVASSDKKSFFVKNGTDDAACPADASACRRKAFLVPGNSIIVSSRTGDFVCATYANAKGVETDGWLPKAAVTIDAEGTGAEAKAWTEAKAWAGTWVREEANVTIETVGKDRVSIHGDATFGAMDPDRVKRGAVNVGEISGTTDAKSDGLSFAMGDDDKTLPVEKGDDSTCKVWMRRVANYLLVDDNNACGGMNVSFRGTYVRR